MKRQVKADSPLTRYPFKQFILVHDPDVLAVYRMLLTGLNNKEDELQKIQEDIRNFDPQNEFETMIASIDNHI
jgi:hypothetical protein